MDLLRTVSLLGRRARQATISDGSDDGKPRQRHYAFEQLEPRRLLAADGLPVQIGAVYYEDDSGEDQGGDLLEFTFNGGAEGTQLVELILDTDKDSAGISQGDPFFDLAPGGSGVFGSRAMTIVTSTGIDRVDIEVQDGGSVLHMTFEGFDQGEKLTLLFDVDEKGFLNASSVVEGEEFEGVKLSGTVTAPHYHDASGNDIFHEEYDSALIASGLDLPPDSYMPPGTEPFPVRTAGAIFAIPEQSPKPNALSGTVFEDLDADNVRDPGESGISQVTVGLLIQQGDSFVNTGLTTRTDDAGHYQFDELASGTYRVVQTQPSGYSSVGARAGTVNGSERGSVLDVDTITDVELLGEETSVGNDFAEVRPGSIAGRVTVDANGNGQYDPDEPLLSGVTIQLRDAQGEVIATDQTDARGEYSFANLMAGSYGVEEIQPERYFDGRDHVGSAGGTLLGSDAIIDIIIVSGTDGVNYDFSEVSELSLSGSVTVDADGDCIHQAGEPVIPGVTIRLLDSQGELLATTTTDALGNYTFGHLPPGVYRIEEIQPEGYIDGGDHVGTAGGTIAADDVITAINLSAGSDGTGYDFCEVQPASLEGFVYVDNDNDGVKDPSEKPIPGVFLGLFDGDGNPMRRTVKTDADGFYRFDDLHPGTYQVKQGQPKGFLDGLDTAGTEGGTAINPGDTIRDILLASGAAAGRYNFGELNVGSLSGTVYLDSDGNCQIDRGETPLSNVTVFLRDDQGNRIRSATTDAQGRFHFDNLLAGEYQLEEIQPKGYFDGRDCPGTAGGTPAGTDRIERIDLQPGQDGVDYFFRELEPATISGYVFQDGTAIPVAYGQKPPKPSKVRNGRRTPDDTPIVGVWLTLGDASGVPMRNRNGGIITTLTDERGYYEFTGLEPNTSYTVLQDQPDAYTDSLDTAGEFGGIALNTASGIDSPMPFGVVVEPRYAGDAIVRIWVGSGDHATGNNFSEVAYENESPFWLAPRTPDSPPLNYPQGAFAGDSTSPYFVPPPVVTRTIVRPGLGGSLGPAPHSWHLSVVNAGTPRRENDNLDRVARVHNAYFNPEVWTDDNMNHAQWQAVDAEGNSIFDTVFGFESALPVAGDFNGDGRAEVGVFFDGLWFLDLNGNGRWDDADLWARLGRAGDLPVVGDWDGDGKDDIGVFGTPWSGDTRAVQAEPGLPDVANASNGRTKNLPPGTDEATVGWRTMKRTASGPVRADVIDHVFRYGTSRDVPIAGDFNGDGVTNIGLFHDGSWYLDIDANGRWSPSDVYIEQMGDSGDMPVVGDFNGDGVDDLGIFRDGVWHLDVNGDRILDGRDLVFEHGAPGDRPVVGDFNGDGIDEPAIYRDGAPAEVPHEAARDGAPVR